VLPPEEPELDELELVELEFEELLEELLLDELDLSEPKIFLNTLPELRSLFLLLFFGVS